MQNFSKIKPQCLQLIFALLRLQFLTTHFSKPLISGFLTAAILHLIMTQVGSVIGVKKPKHKDATFGEFFYVSFSLISTK
jgi:MFS superfamily sulfate permease-like transporter